RNDRYATDLIAAGLNGWRHRRAPGTAGRPGNALSCPNLGRPWDSGRKNIWSAWIRASKPYAARPGAQTSGRGDMSFTSWQFALFAVIVLAVYYLPPLRNF